MKHLKRFNESVETNVLDQSVVDDCKDILLELEDKGIETNIHSYFNSGVSIGEDHNKNWITFFFNREKDFDYSDIEDVVERLKSYLSEYDLSISFIFLLQSSRSNRELFAKFTLQTRPTF